VSHYWQGNSQHILCTSRAQVLVSLQGLVLVRNPYFNEAGYEKQMGTLDGERNAGPYNESAFLAAVKTSVRLLQAPPPPFKPLVRVGFKPPGFWGLKGIVSF
jgi:ubiquitin-conjugating enzyme E2 O